jgi:flagellar basal body P-ring protein FlgI
MPLVPRQLNPSSRRGCAALPLEYPAGEKPKPRTQLAIGFLKAEIKFVKIILPVWILLAAFSVFADSIRLRDLVMVAGARDNQLVGYGLVTGLMGEGDKDQIYTKQSVANMLQRYGINIPAATISAKNVAVVMVTADIPAFVKPGSRIDVTVSSLGDAKSLTGGVLLQTPLIGADNKIYAVAQGALATGGFAAGDGGAGGATVTKNYPNTGQIVNGALVEREIPATIVRDNKVELLLREPSFTSAAILATAINEVFTNSTHAADLIRSVSSPNWKTSRSRRKPLRHASSSTNAPARLWRPRASIFPAAPLPTATSPSTSRRR